MDHSLLVLELQQDGLATGKIELHTSRVFVSFTQCLQRNESEGVAPEFTAHISMERDITNNYNNLPGPLFNLFDGLPCL